MERARLYFLLAWFHAIVQERLVYAPLGWSKHYEFNESDLRCACDTIDVWIDSVAMVSLPLLVCSFAAFMCFGRLRGTVVGCRSLAGELCLFCA